MKSTSSVTFGDSFPSRGSLGELSFFKISDLEHYGALNSLLEELTAVLIYAANRSGGMIGVSRTAARAIETCPAVLALLAGVCVANTELVLNGGVLHALKHVTEKILLVTKE